MFKRKSFKKAIFLLCTITMCLSILSITVSASIDTQKFGYQYRNREHSCRKKVAVSGEVTLSEGTPKLSKVTLKLLDSENNICHIVKAKKDGSYLFPAVTAGTNYTIEASLDGYYSFTSTAFNVEENDYITDINLYLARKEPVITTQNYTTITRNTNGLSIEIDLSTGKNYEAQVMNLGHIFSDDMVTNPLNWNIDTSDTGLILDSIIRNNDTKVTINFTGTASKTRAFTVQSKAAAVSGPYSFDSNVLTFSVTDDGYITSSNPNLDTYYAKNINVNGETKAVIIMVHGLAEHLGRYNEVVENLNKAGYAVYRLDNKGHGRTEKTELNGDPVNGYVDDYNEYLDDVDIIVEMAKQDFPDKEIYMLGHSMGGFITAMYGMKYPAQLNGQIFSGPAVGIFNEALIPLVDNPLSPYELDKYGMVPNALTSTVCRDKAIQDYYYVDPLRLTQYAKKLMQEWIEGSYFLSLNVENYSYPTLILHGSNDRIVNETGSEWFYNTISSTDKTRIVYPDLFHEILNERNEKGQVMNDIISWLNDKVN